MSRLDELEEELYTPGEEEHIRERMERRVLFPKSLQKPQTFWSPRDPKSSLRVSEGEKKRMTRFLIGAGIILIIGAGALATFLYLSTRGEEALVTIQGGEGIGAGEEIVVPIAVKNIGKASLTDLELSVVLPEGSFIWEGGEDRPAPQRISRKIDPLGVGEETTVEIRARMFGREGEERHVEAILLYRPENLRARFSARGSKTLRIERVPLTISWDVPDSASHGQLLPFTVRYQSIGNIPFENVAMRLEFPPGFSIERTEPNPSAGDAIWELGALDPEETGTITFAGIISGEEAEVKVFRAELGLFNSLTKEWRPFIESTREVRLAVAPLSVQLFLDEKREGIVKPGDRLKFLVRYRNNTQATIRNITVKTFLEGDILDLTTLSLQEGGVYNGGSRAIVWGPGATAQLRSLGPGDEGSFFFFLAARPRPRVQSEADRNLTVRARATIDAADIPQELAGVDLRAEDALVFKVESEILFSGKSLYYASFIPNTGPLPPKRGAKTTYTLVWEIRNFTNDLRGVEVRAGLPPNVKWEGVIFPPDARLAFLSNASEVRWVAGEIKAGTGVLTSAATVAFQVSITPSEADVGGTVTLLKEATLTAIDAFTSEAREEKTGALSTQLREDPQSSTNDWHVVE